MASIECGTADLNVAVVENGVKVLTVNASVVTADSKILLTYTSQSTGFLSVGTIVPGTSFQVVSSNQADTSSVNWLVVNNVSASIASAAPAVVTDLLSSAPVNAIMTSAPMTALCSAVAPRLTNSSIWSALTCKKRGPPVVPTSDPVNAASGALTVVRSVDVSGSAVTVDAVVAVVEPTVLPASSS
jgi:hypothetical protein